MSSEPRKAARSQNHRAWHPETEEPSLCWKDLVDAGLVGSNVRPTITITLAELLVIVDVLQDDHSIAHYLLRRAEWEKYMSYHGDEEDLLVHYLSNGLNRIVDHEGNELDSMVLHGNSDQLRHFYMSEWADAGSDVPRPKRLMTSWWRRLIDRATRRESPDRLIVSQVLLDVGYRQQQDIEHWKTRILSKRRLGEKFNDEDAILLPIGTRDCPSAIVCFAYCEISRELRNRRAQSLIDTAQERSHGNRIVVVGFDVDLCTDPYDVLMFCDRSESAQSDGK